MEHDTQQRPVLFISDLHLDPKRPEIVALFLRFLGRAAEEAQALYILGDLFEAWIGDDAVPADDSILAAMRAFADTGTPLYVMRGNRDFLLGELFAERAGATLLADPTPIRIDGEPVLLMHGDSLCTDDDEYQQFRAMVRDPHWQARFLALPVEERIAQASRARSESTARNSTLDDDIMDVNADAVAETMRAYGARRLIHGHTHRPAVHDFTLDGAPAQRVVLGDWYHQGSVLRWEAGDCALRALPVS